MKTKTAKKKKRTGAQKAVLWCSILLLTWAMLPYIANGIFGIGVLLPAAVALAGILWSLRRPTAKQKRTKGWKKAVVTIGVALGCVIAITAGLITGLMIRAAVTTPREGATVVVLGSKIYDDRPSRMLRDRLNAAADYLDKHPTANCVVSGGLGEGETYTEAYVMRKYLVEQRGIDEARIACEDTSTDTHENIHNSMAIIREKGWGTNLAIATQVFHQYRSRQLAQMAGADSVGGVACLTPVHLMLNYWVRECAAICRLWLLRY